MPHKIADGQAGLSEVCGGSRGLYADLAVVDDLSRLVDCSDDATVNQVLSIAGRGVPVITRASWVRPLAKVEFRSLSTGGLRLCRFVHAGELMYCGLGSGKTDA